MLAGRPTELDDEVQVTSARRIRIEGRGILRDLHPRLGRSGALCVGSGVGSRGGVPGIVRHTRCARRHGRVELAKNGVER